MRIGQWKGRLGVAVAAFLGIGVLLAGCGVGSGTTSSVNQNTSPSQRQAAGPHSITLLLDWYPNVDHAWLYAALHEGYFQQEGLDVRVQVPSDTTDPLKLVAAGKADLGIGYMKDVLIARSQGIPVKSVAALVQHALNVVMSIDPSIRTPQDLAGKRIGNSGTPADEAILRAIENKVGPVQSINVGYELVPSLATHKVDAIVGGYVNVEQLELKSKGFSVRAFPLTDFGIPDTYELVLLASDTTVEHDPQMIQAFLRAAQRGQQYAEAHPDEAVAFLQAASKDIDPKLTREGMGILFPLQQAEGHPFGWQELSRWKAVDQWLQANALLAKPVDAKDAFWNVAGATSP
ncbi:MAG: ABC transporter substrate-binding protein [Firmicutes bacterium]|nr:ABC transporter substrate-binding protein [Bacillota bacterium]